MKVRAGAKLVNCLLCDNVVIGDRATLLQGAMVDKNVVIKDDAVLDKCVASCLTITTSSKGVVSFTKIESETNSDIFQQGAICHLPLEMQLKPYQMMG